MVSISHPPGFLDAVRTGDLETVKLLLDRGADPNAFEFFNSDDENSKLPALYWASEHNHVPIVRLLLERGANPNDGESTYHSAQHGHLECLELLLAHGADISGRHPHWRNTPLYFLAGHTDDEGGAAPWLRGLKWLLDHGADPNVPSSAKAETPLHALVRSSRTIAATAALLDHGAAVDQPRADGRTPYAVAVRSGNDAAAALLRSRGAAAAGLTPVDRLLGACMRGDETAARAIVASDPAIMQGFTEEDRAILARAADENRAAALRLMAALGFDLTWEGEDGGTPLHHAAWLGRAALVELLLDLGAPVNVRDRTYGSSPIAWAAHGSTNCRSADDDYCAVVERLLAAGSDYAAAINKWGEPPAPMASPRVAALLKARGFEPAV